MSDLNNQKIISRVEGLKSLVLFFSIASAAYILLIVTGLSLFGSENNISFWYTLARIIMLGVPYVAILYLAYILYTTKKIKKAKNSLVLLGLPISIFVLYSLVELNWVSLIIYLILMIEIFNLYKKVSKLDSQV